jgi:hypothetical protein
MLYTDLCSVLDLVTASGYDRPVLGIAPVCFVQCSVMNRNNGEISLSGLIVLT